MTYEFFFDLAGELTDFLVSSWSLVIQCLSFTFNDLVAFINSFPGWSVSEWLLSWLATTSVEVLGVTFVLGELSLMSLVFGGGLVFTIIISVIKWIIGVIT